MMTDTVGYLGLVSRAEARSGACQWSEAVVLWEQVIVRNPVKGDHWARLAEARFELEDYAGARTAYEKVGTLGVRPNERPGAVFPGDQSYLTAGEVAYRIASCYAGDGDLDGAIDALAAALRKGFRDLGRVGKDEQWKSLRDDRRVRDLLGITDADGLSRVDGWRADLGLLAREIKRRAHAPFATISEEDFDRAVADLDRELAGLTYPQVIIAMMKLLPALGDGHAFILPPHDSAGLGTALPVEFYLFTEGVFVVAADPSYRQLLGARIDSIDGHPLDEVLSALEQIISRDNDQQVKFMGPLWLRWVAFLHAMGLTAEAGQATLAVQFLDGTTGEVTVKAMPAEEWNPHPYPHGWLALHDTLPQPPPLHLRNRDLAYWFDYLPDADLVYFQFNGVRDHPAETLAAFSDRLFAFTDSRPSTKLVIDMRWNGGGNTFLGQPLLHHLIGSQTINRRGELFVIVGRNTFSAAQNIATAIERETQAIFVGEPTGSRPNFIGETIPFELPNTKATANIADLYWQTSWPMDYRPWIAPEIYAPPTFAAYSRNTDPAMEGILTCHEHFPNS